MGILTRREQAAASSADSPGPSLPMASSVNAATPLVLASTLVVAGVAAGTLVYKLLRSGRDEG